MSNDEKTTRSLRCVWTTKILKILKKLMHNYTNLLHRVIHRHECLQPLPMEEVGELHVDRSHGACVLHDPVFVHIWSIVVAGGAGRPQGGREDTDMWKNSLYLGSTEQPCTVCLMKLHRSKKIPLKMLKNTCLLLFTKYCSVTGATVVPRVWHA